MQRTSRVAAFLAQVGANVEFRLQALGVELRTYCRRDMHVEPLRSLREPSNQMGPLCGRFICIATECSVQPSFSVVAVVLVVLVMLLVRLMY